MPKVAPRRKAAKRKSKTRPRAKPANLPIIVEPDGALTSLEADGSIKRDASHPVDPFFFSTIRLLFQHDRFRRPYEQHPWVFATMSAISSPLSQVPFRLFREKDKSNRSRTTEVRVAAVASVLKFHPERVHRRIGSIRSVRERFREVRRIAPTLDPESLCRAVLDAEVVEQGEWFTLMQRPSSDTTRSQLWEASVINRGIDGESFWKLNGMDGKKIGSEAEVPKEILVTTLEGWTDVTDDDLRLVGWKYERAGKRGKKIKETRELWQVVHAKRVNPIDPHRGLSPIRTAKLDLESDFQAMLWNLAFFKNGAHPGGYLFTEKKLSPDKKKDILEAWEERHQDSRKSHRPDILEGGLKFVPSVTSQRDMEFTKMRAWTRDVVMGIYRTSKVAMGISDDVNRANAKEGRQQHWEDVIIPEGQYHEDLLDAQLFTDKRAGQGGADFGAFDWSVVDALNDDMEIRIESAKGLVAIGVPFNEAAQRMELGVEERPWGETWYRENKLIPVNALEEQTEPEPPPEDDATPFAFDAGATAKRLEGSVALLEGAQAKRLNEKGKEIDEKLFIPSIRGVSKQLDAYFFKLRAEQLRVIAGVDDIALVDSLLFDLPKWSEKMQSRMEPEFLRIVKLTDDFTDAEVPDERSALEPLEVTTEAFDLSSQIARSVETVRTELRGLFEDIFSTGDTVTKDLLSRRVRSFFSSLRAQGRLSMIAETMAGTAINKTRTKVMQRKKVKRHLWIDRDDEVVRETHQIYGSAGAIEIGRNWADFSGGSYTLLFPHDWRAPAAEIINCRCFTVAA